MVASRCAQLCVLDCQRSSEIFGVVVYGKMRSEDRIYLRVYEILSVPCPVSCSRLNLLKMEDGRRERGARGERGIHFMMITLWYIYTYYCL